MGNEMLFGWLVEYQIRHNLADCLEDIPEWKKCLKKRHATEETHSNKYTGFLIFANGDTLVDELIERKIIQDEERPTFVPVASKDKFFEYFNFIKGSDGVFAYNGKHGSLARVNEMTNNLPRPHYTSVLPKNFVDDSEIYAPTEGNIGTKTKLALKVSMVYPENVDVFQIKRTIYNNLGMGIVTDYKAGHLSEMFYLTTAPENYKGPLINSEHNILGVYVSYKNTKGTIIEDKKHYVGLDSEGKMRFYSDKIISPDEIPSLGLDGLMLSETFDTNYTSHTKNYPPPLNVTGGPTPQPAGRGTKSNGYLGSAGLEGFFS